jgi:membrane protease YdiL (CAAX protease family)
VVAPERNFHGSSNVTSNLKSAFTLSAAYGVSAAVTVPLLLPALPPEARNLPLPLPAFCVLLGMQMTAIYGLFAWGGIRLARGRGLEPTPALFALYDEWRWQIPWRAWGIAALVGLGCGMGLVTVVMVIKQVAPHSLPSTLHPPSPLAALFASLTGSIGEEILCRLFLLSLLLRALPIGAVTRWIALAVSALLFGALHAPALVFLFGGLDSVPPLAWVWIIMLNGLAGTAFGVLYLRSGIGAAIVAHFATDCVWHVASQLAA